MTKRQKPLPPELRDGQYRGWEVEMMQRFPLALSEMRWPSVPLHMVETQPLARWGIDINVGWRPIMERLLVRLEAAITAQPVDERDRCRILQVKEKFGRLTVYLADSTPEIDAAIQEASEESIRIECESKNMRPPKLNHGCCGPTSSGPKEKPVDLQRGFLLPPQQPLWRENGGLDRDSHNRGARSDRDRAPSRP